MTDVPIHSSTVAIRFRFGDPIEIGLTDLFVLQLRKIIDDDAAGYVDIGDFVREALRAELDKAQRRISNAVRWSRR